MPTAVSVPLLQDGNLRQTDILHHSPDNGETTGFRSEGINLIGTLPDIAKEACNRVGTANVAMHDLREGIKCQEMLFIFTEAADGFGITLLVFGFKSCQIEQCILFLLLRCQIPANSVLTSLRSRWGMALSTLRCLCTTQRCRGVAEKRAETAARSPSCPSVTISSIWVAPRLRRSCKRQLHPSLSSSAQTRNANTSLFPSRSTPSAVKMMVESVWVPCRTVKWISVLRTGCGSGEAEDALATFHIAQSTFGSGGSPRWHWVQPP